MQFSKSISIIALSFALAACSGSPSDSDVQAVFKDAVKQLEQVYAPLGINFSDTFDVETKIKNKSKQDDGRWLVQVEMTMRAKKDWAQGKKGEIVGAPQVSTVNMKKGDNGWIAE